MRDERAIRAEAERLARDLGPGVVVTAWSSGPSDEEAVPEPAPPAAAEPEPPEEPEIAPEPQPAGFWARLLRLLGLRGPG